MGVKSILPGVKPTEKRRSVLSEDKYAPGNTSRWKHVSARYSALYQALLDELDQVVRKSMYGITVRKPGEDRRSYVRRVHPRGVARESAPLLRT